MFEMMMRGMRQNLHGHLANRQATLISTERRSPCNVSFVWDVAWERAASDYPLSRAATNGVSLQRLRGEGRILDRCTAGRVLRRASELHQTEHRCAHRVNTLGEIHENFTPSISPIGSGRSRVPGALSRRKSADISVAAGPSAGRLCSRRRQ